MSVGEFCALQGEGRIIEWQAIWEETVVNLSRYCFFTHLENSRKTSRKMTPRNAVTPSCSLITFNQLNFLTDICLAATDFFRVVVHISSNSRWILSLRLWRASYWRLTNKTSWNLCWCSVNIVRRIYLWSVRDLTLCKELWKSMLPPYSERNLRRVNNDVKPIILRFNTPLLQVKSKNGLWYQNNIYI